MWPSPIRRKLMLILSRSSHEPLTLKIGKYDASKSTGLIKSKRDASQSLKTRLYLLTSLFPRLRKKRNGFRRRFL